MSFDLDHAGFEGGCSESILIGRPREQVFAALHRMERWPEHLPHVKGIEVLYDDGQYQEFYMNVDSNGTPIRVRSVRNCREPDTIEFFQPQPPVFLLHHAGGWEFHAATPESCLLVTHHRWNLRPEVAAEKFPPAEGRSSEQQVADLLRDHARIALERWKLVLEQVPEEALHAAG